MAVEVRVLGPLEVLRDGRDVTPAAAKQRVVLTALVLAVGRPVSVAQLVDDVWGESPVGSARKTLQVYVARLREVLGDDVIRTAGEGYRVDIGAVRLDQRDFDAAVHAADAAEAAGDVDEAVRSLRVGLALWRGEPLANVPSDSLQQRAAASMAERGLQVAERCCDLEVARGRADVAVVELRALVDGDPRRERSWALLMRALYASGRQAEALSAYQQAAEALAEQLGVDPGVELRQTHQDILIQTLTVPHAEAQVRAAPMRVEVPRQLPARPAGFVGRRDQVDQLTAWLDDPSTTPVVVVSGAPGVGKSALAVATGHRLADRFPDGQLFVDARGFATEQALTAAEVLPRFLRALGFAGDQSPADVDELASMYRSTISGKRVLVVVDNAASADLVRPLLPGTPGCAVLVTSRNRLHPLVAVEGARLLPLDVLSLDEARSALAAQVDERRLTAEPEAVDQLARLCGWLPLALRIAGAHLATNPHDSVGAHVTELGRGGQLTSLWSGADESLVAAAFATSYTALDQATRRVFRLLGLVPGTDFSVDAVAALTGDTDARRVLGVLAAASLVDPCSADRYRMHDLVREYARQRAERDDEVESRNEARRRLLDWYVAMVDAALVPRFRHFYRLPRAAPVERLTSAASIDWIDAELPNLVVAATEAAEHGLPEHVWHLADALRAYFGASSRLAEWSAMVRVAVDVADRHGSLQVRATMREGVAQLAYRNGEIDAAVDASRQAQALFAEAGDHAGEAYACHNECITHIFAGRFDQARVAGERAVELGRRYGNRQRVQASERNLALVKAEMGLLGEALADLEEFSGRPDSRGDGRVWTYLRSLRGLVCRRLGRLPEAADDFAECISIAMELGNLTQAADTRTELARCYCDAGDLERARAESERAIELTAQLGQRRFLVEARTVAAEIDLRSGDATTAVQQLMQLVEEDMTGQLRLRARILDVLTWAHVATGAHATALSVGDHACELGRERSLRLVEDAGLTVTTAALVGLGRMDEAVDRGVEALRRHRETGYRLREARTLCHLGDAHHGRGDLPAAIDCWQCARDVYLAMGTKESADAERRLAAVDVQAFR